MGALGGTAMIMRWIDRLVESITTKAEAFEKGMSDMDR